MPIPIPVREAGCSDEPHGKRRGAVKALAGTIETSIPADPPQPARLMAGKAPAKGRAKAVAKPGAQPKVPRRPGAPSTFTEQLGEEICRRMAEGETLTEICRSPGMPAFFSVHRWAERHPAFGEAFACAHEAQAHRWAEEIIDISDDSRNDWITRPTERGEEAVVNHEYISRSKLRVDSR